MKNDQKTLNDLKHLMKHLRDPDNGCPWDIEQNFETIKPHTIEEAYEVADAIERGHMDDLKDELGDLLFQVVFHAQMADEQNFFTLDDVIDHVTKKMIFRHPHVFENDNAINADDVRDRIWEEQKEKEKGQSRYTLDQVTMALPSLLLAQKIQKKAIKKGFEFKSIDNVFDKMEEELNELREAMKQDNSSAVFDEYGDVLFVSALIGQSLSVNGEEALRQSCKKFKARFNIVEDLAEGDLQSFSPKERQNFWQQAKETVG